jgi:hypothetical protein
MRNEDPDYAPGYQKPRGWRNAKLALGWKPEVDRADEQNHLIGAMLDFETAAVERGDCVRLMLSIALRHFLLLNTNERRQAVGDAFDFWDRRRAADDIDRNFRACVFKIFGQDQLTGATIADIEQGRVGIKLADLEQKGDHHV